MILWLLAALSLGLAAAFVAYAKGRSFLPWLAYGMLFSVIALPRALMLGKKKLGSGFERQPLPGLGGYPPFSEYRKPGWMMGDADWSGIDRAELSMPEPGRCNEVSAAWLEDAFARITGDGPHSAAQISDYGDWPSRGVTRGNLSRAARRVEEKADATPATAASGRLAETKDADVAESEFRLSQEQDPPPVEAAEDAVVPEMPLPRKLNGHGRQPRDFRRGPRPMDEGDCWDASVGRGDADAAEQGLEPGFDFYPSNGRTYRESTVAWIARRFAADPPTSRLANSLRYGAAVLCVVISAVLVGLQISKLVDPPRIQTHGRISSSAAVTPKTEPSSSVTRAGTAIPVTHGTLNGTHSVSRPADNKARTHDGAPQANAGSDQTTSVAPVPSPSSTLTSLTPSSGSAVEEPIPTVPPRVRPTVPKTPQPHIKPTPAGQVRTKKVAAKGSGTNRKVISATGQVVVLVQAELKKRGYNPGRVDGRAGEETRQAIRAFNQHEGLTPNSDIDHQLLEHLGIVGHRLHPFTAPASKP